MKNIVIVFVVIGVLAFVYMLIFDNGTSSPSTSNVPSATTSSNSAPVVIKEQPRQNLIRAFLAKELELDNELQRGNDEVANAGREFDYGVPLPYIIKAELIFEKVLEEGKALVAPPGAENVKTYLVEATSYALSGVKKTREGLESYPVDKTKLGQGIELYTKSQMPLARKNAEIDKLKQEVGI